MRRLVKLKEPSARVTRKRRTERRKPRDRSERTGRCSLAIFLERQLAVVLAQEIQKPLVVARLHIEKLRDNLVVTSSILESFAHEVADVAACDFALHIKRVDNGPERLALLYQFLIEIV